MSNVVPILLVWALLAVGLVGYVVYRLVTDREQNDRRHALYPLVSNPTDGMIPRRNRTHLVGYGIMAGGMFGFLVIMGLSVTDSAIPSWLLYAVGLMLVLGFVISRNGRSKPDTDE